MRNNNDQNNNDQKKGKNLSRGDFLKASGALATGFTFLPSSVVSGLGHTAPSDKLNIAGIGVGGIGRRNLHNIKGQNIVALCDVDWDYAAKTFKEFPDAQKYEDFRRMLDEMEDEIDAVVIGTPDHTHYVTAAEAMRRGIHVYLQKPLTKSVYESRKLAELANETGVVTQMGNQGNSGEGIRKICEWIWNGEIGEVKEAHCWTNRPIWPQGLEVPGQTPNVPPTLNWDLFVGPAPWRHYHPSYTPWNWRAWWDYGTGALGDMGCHIVDPVFKALDLGHPDTIEGSSTRVFTESAPRAEKVIYEFPRREKKHNVEMPPVKLTWYDGGFMPERPEGLPDGKRMGDRGGGAMFVGTKGTLICSTYARNPYIIGREENPPKAPQTLRRVPDFEGGDHEMDWVEACKEEDPERPSANFNYSGPMNEVVVMGNLAVRLQSLNRPLQWDGENMKITNIDKKDKVRFVSSYDFEVVSGDPKFNVQHEEFDAREAAARYIKPRYRKGWSY